MARTAFLLHQVKTGSGCHKNTLEKQVVLAGTKQSSRLGAVRAA